jgi:predicted enzyme related to lactoylglutathione lyase
MLAKSVAEFSLLVLRSTDLTRAERFYNVLGITFSRERHGTGPEHLAAHVGSIVFEIYPQENETDTEATRIGFALESVAALIPMLQGAGGTVLSSLRPSPWSLRAVVADPDGHRVELVCRNA